MNKKFLTRKFKSCLICQTKEVFAFNKNGYQLNRCPACQLYRTVLLKPYRQFLKAYYNRSYFTGSHTRAGYAHYQGDQLLIRFNARNFLRLIKRHQSRGRLLDVGCASGTFMAEAAKQGYQVYGIDVSPYAVSLAKKLFPLSVKLTALSQTKFPKRSFSIITYFDVFEHVNDPAAELKRCHHLLKKNGILVINTDDTNSLLARLQGAKWHFFIPPQHLYFYSQKNLIKFLQQNGFTVERVYRPGKLLSLRYILHLIETINHSNLAGILYRLVHQNFLGKIPVYFNLGDNMTLIARKK